MKKLTFELEFITPAFIGGANQEKAELRPASFVGLLRWWWRALKSECDLGKLNREEVEIFGGNGERASKVTLRVFGDVRYVEAPFNQSYRLQWSYDKARRTLVGPQAGIGYLFFSMNLQDRVRRFIESGSRFSITLIGQEEYLKHYEASLWALVFLGGVGSRARRGGGNLAVVKAPDGLPISFTPAGDVVQWYRENLERAKAMVGATQRPCKKYSNLHGARIKVGDNLHKSWIEALNEIGTRFMNYRFSVKGKIFESAIFGIPIRHASGWVNTSSEEIKRRSSPLIIKVIKTPQGYRWVLVKLSGEFLPRGVRLSFNRRLGDPDPSFLEKFLDEE